MNGTRPRRSSDREAGSARPDDPRDDWLGDVSDDDWNEGAAESAAHTSASAARQLSVPDGERMVESVPTGPPRAAGADRTPFARRRLVAVLLVFALAGLAGVLAVVVLGGDEPSSSAPVTQPDVTTTATTTTTTTTTETTTAPEPTTPTTSTPTTTEPETGGATGFTLPEGTKLQRDAENDAAVVRELQQALTAAGYNPGPADGTYGEQTEAAVVAFQQANGLSVDGRVGPETAAALNSALAGG